MLGKFLRVVLSGSFKLSAKVLMEPPHYELTSKAIAAATLRRLV